MAIVVDLLMLILGRDNASSKWY